MTRAVISFDPDTWMFRAQHLQDLKEGDLLVKLSDYGIGTPKHTVYTFHSYHPTNKYDLLLCGLNLRYLHIKELYDVGLSEHSVEISDFRRFNPETDTGLPVFSPERYREALRGFIQRWGA